MSERRKPKKNQRDVSRSLLRKGRRGCRPPSHLLTMPLFLCHRAQGWWGNEEKSWGKRRERWGCRHWDVMRCCVFFSLSLSLSLSPFKKWNCEGNEYVHKQAQFWVGSVPSVPLEKKKIYIFCTRLYCQNPNKVNMTTSPCSAI